MNYLRFESSNPLFRNCAYQVFRFAGQFGRGDLYHVCREGFLWLDKQHVPFHGDLVIVKGHCEWACRFNSGSLDWIRPVAELSAAQRKIIPFQSSNSSVENAAALPPTMNIDYAGIAVN